MATRVEPSSSSGQRDWWLRAVLVLQSPQSVFAALKDESLDAVEDRQEPVTALVYLGGIAGVLLAPAFGHLKDDYSIDALGVIVIVIFAGAIYGFFAYLLLGWVLSRGIKALGGAARPQSCRHVLAYSLAPLALSLLVVWPVRLALYGEDLFESGGSDSSTAGEALRWLCAAFAAWSVVLLVVGVRTIQGWTWWRAAGAAFFAVALLGVVLWIWAFIGGAAHPYR